MRGATPDKPPMLEPLTLTERGTVDELAGRPDPDIEDPKPTETPTPGRATTPLENNPMQAGPEGPPTWDIEWAAERAAVAMRYLADNCPASAGAPELHPWQDEAHAAAVACDEARYLEALRGYVRAGQEVQRRARKGAA